MADETQPQLPPPSPVKITPPEEMKSVRRPMSDVFWTVLILVMWLVVIVAAILLVLAALYLGWGILKWVYGKFAHKENIKAMVDFLRIWV